MFEQYTQDKRVEVDILPGIDPRTWLIISLEAIILHFSVTSLIGEAIEAIEARRD